MAVIGKLGRNIGLGTEYLAEVSVAGPASYVTGGFTLDTLLTAITRVTVSCRDGRIATPADTIRAYRYTIAAGVLTIIVDAVSTVGAGPNSFAELAAAQDISTITWDVIAIGTP